MSETSIDVSAVLRRAAEFISGGNARTAVGAISAAAGSVPPRDTAVTAFLSHLGLDLPSGAAARLALCDSVARGRLNSVELAARLREAADGAAKADSASRKEAV